MNRNLFDLDNARYLLKRELVDTFIPTDSFNKLLSPKNQIIIGSRGSGKTALLKMISHDYLSLLDSDLARDVISNKTFIGIHISTKTKFGGGLKNKEWQNDLEKETHFKWLMNVASCVALLDTLKSCLNQYVEDSKSRIATEIEIISQIRKYWFSIKDEIYTIDDIAQKLEDLVIEKSKRNLEFKISGIKSDDTTMGLAFDLDLFEPLIAAINVINRKLSFPDYTTWFICIDEIEILEPFHHRILNSYMRANMGNIFFKFTTLPYCHYTLETNLNVQLDIRHDVHYVYVDQDVSFQYRVGKSESNAYKLFKKRAEFSKPEISGYDFQELFGKSKLLESRNIDYSSILSSKSDVLDEIELRDVISKDITLTLFDMHTNEKTRSKGLDLLRNKKVKEFGDQFGRKLRALLFLKDYQKNLRGNQNIELYCGAKTVINLADANPRKLIGIFNEMISKINTSAKTAKTVLNEERVPLISYSDQNFVLASVSEKEISRYRIEKNFGKSLYEFINVIGDYMHEHIHKQKINTEQISSIEVSEVTDEVTWKIVERAVQKGLLYPNINIHNPDDMPYRVGTFHLAFILSPKFKLLPRKGDSKNIAAIVGPVQLKINFDA